MGTEVRLFGLRFGAPIFSGVGSLKPRFDDHFGQFALANLTQNCARIGDVLSLILRLTGCYQPITSQVYLITGVTVKQ